MTQQRLTDHPDTRQAAIAQFIPAQIKLALIEKKESAKSVQWELIPSSIKRFEEVK